MAAIAEVKTEALSGVSKPAKVNIDTAITTSVAALSRAASLSVLRILFARFGGSPSDYAVCLDGCNTPRPLRGAPSQSLAI